MKNEKTPATSISAKKPCLILMFPEKKANAAELEDAVRATGSCEVERIHGSAELIDRAMKGGIQGLVCNVTNFDVPLLSLLNKAKDLCRQMLTVVVSEQIEEKVVQELKKIEKIISVEQPNSVKSMALLCERIVQGREISERKQRRYSTNQKATIQRLDSSDPIEAKVYNMSKGGVYIELAKGSLAVKDIVKVVIQLDSLGKERVVHGRVMWTSARGLVEQRFGCGLEFINSDEAYIAMLEKI